MPKLADWIKETVSGTPGTGTITLGGAYSTAFCRFQDQFTTGDKVYYSIEDGNNREEGYGTLTSGTPWKLARTTVLRTIDAGTFDNTSPAAISLTSAAVVGIASASDTMGIVCGVGYAETTSLVSGSTSIPSDDTIPQNTEGFEVITLAYTPKFADSLLHIESILHTYISNGSLIPTGALFIDSTANALSVGWAFHAANTGLAATFSFDHYEISGNTTARTYKLRAGAGATTTLEINGVGGVRRYGGVMKTHLRITEYRQ